MQINSRLLGIAILAVPALVHAQGVPKPNVLVIVLDDVAVDKVTSYAGDYPGYAPTYLPSTQTLDTLASRGLRFKRAWATPLCSSTRVALETGKQPWRTGIGTALGNAAVGVDPALHLTLGESFQLDGYDTGKFGKHHMGTRDAAGAVGYPASSPYFVEPHVSLMGWDRFFGDYDGYVGAAPGVGYFNWKRVDWLGGTATGYTAMENTGTHATDRVIGVAGDWITSRTQPWLAMVSLHAGHSGTTASTTWTVADVDTNPTNYRTASLSCLAAGTCLDEKRQAYRALVEHADIAIAELLTRLPQTTIDNTLIVVMGDNGTPIAVEESVFNVVGRGKGTIYENGVRVPLIVAEGKAWRTGVPGTRIPVINRRIDARVNTLDIYQTLLDVAGNPVVVPNKDSSSFLPCFTINDPYCGWVAKRYGYTEMFTSTTPGAGTKVAVSWGEDTMTACYKPANACMKETFYDTATDVLQTTPQAWVGVRAQRLRDRFAAIHAGTGSWADLGGGTTIPFCAAAVPAC